MIASLFRYVPIPYNKSSEAIFVGPSRGPLLISPFLNKTSQNISKGYESPISGVYKLEYDEFKRSLSTSVSSRDYSMNYQKKKQLSSTPSSSSMKSSMNLKILFGEVDDTIVRITKQIDQKDNSSFLEVCEYQLQEGDRKISTQLCNTTEIPADFNTSLIIKEHYTLKNFTGDEAGDSKLRDYQCEWVKVKTIIFLKMIHCQLLVNHSAFLLIFAMFLF